MVVALTVGAAAGLVQGQGRAATSSCTRVGDLIAAHPNSYTLPAGVYDNSCAELVVPAGYRLLGQGDATLVLLARRAQDLAEVGPRATVAYMKWLVKGSPNDVTDGVDPCPGCWGVRMLSHSTADTMTLQGTTLGFMLSADHVRIINSTSEKNLYGAFQDIGNTTGNEVLRDDYLTGNARAGIGIHPWAKFDSGFVDNVHMGFEPYCWYADDGLPNPAEYAITNITSISESCESPHRVDAYHFGARKTSGLWVQPHTPGGVMWQAGAPAPVRTLPGQTVILGAGGDQTNGPLLGAQGVAP
jgi:hypothetical protein